MTEKEFMTLLNRYVEACDDLGAGLFQQTEAETNAKHAKAKDLHGQIAAEVSRLHELRSALLDCARRCEALKRPCGMDPESPQALRNGEYMSIALNARLALGPNVAIKRLP